MDNGNWADVLACLESHKFVQEVTRFIQHQTWHKNTKMTIIQILIFLLKCIVMALILAMFPCPLLLHYKYITCASQTHAYTLYKKLYQICKNCQIRKISNTHFQLSSSQTKDSNIPLRLPGTQSNPPAHRFKPRSGVSSSPILVKFLKFKSSCLHVFECFDMYV